MFPNQISLNKNKRLKKKHHLTYINITHTIQKLTLTYTKTHHLYNKKIYHHPSHFINKLPKKYIKKIHLHTTVNHPINHQRMDTPMVKNNNNYKLNQHIHHTKFNKNTIINIKNNNKHNHLQITFQNQKIK